MADRKQRKFWSIVMQVILSALIAPGALYVFLAVTERATGRMALTACADGATAGADLMDLVLAADYNCVVDSAWQQQQYTILIPATAVLFGIAASILSFLVLLDQHLWLPLPKSWTRHLSAGSGFAVLGMLLFVILSAYFLTVK